MAYELCPDEDALDIGYVASRAATLSLYVANGVFAMALVM